MTLLRIPTAGVTNLAVCVENEGYELDLRPGLVYEVVPDESIEPDDVRVIDETGEDYIYPARFFDLADYETLEIVAYP